MSNVKDKIVAYMLQNFKGNEPYVFISYSHAEEDVAKVYPLLEILMERGINFAIDTEYIFMNGDWVDKMESRLVSTNCKCMMSFYSPNYMYSRPSLLEQLLRYSKQVEYWNGERRKTYNQETKVSMLEKKEMPSISVSLFGSRDIKSKLYKKDIDDLNAMSSDEQIKIREEEEKYKKIKDKVFGRKNTFAFKAEEIQIFGDGLLGFYESTSLKKEFLGRLDQITKSEDLENVRKIFYDIMKKENNALLDSDLEGIIARLSQFGVKEKNEGTMGGVLEKEKIVPTNAHTYVEDVISTQPSVSLWHYKVKEADAFIEWDGNSKNCVVQAGSKVAKEADKFSNITSAYNLKRKLEQEGIINNDIFVRHYECDTIATMMNLIYGGSVSFPRERELKRFVKCSETATISTPQLMSPQNIESTIQFGSVNDEYEKDSIGKNQNQNTWKKYTVSGKKYDAVVRVEMKNGKEVYIVECGSKVSPEWKTWIGKSIRNDIESAGCVDAFGTIVMEYEFASISTVAKFIKGMSTSGAEIISDKNCIASSNPFAVTKFF